MTNEKLAFLAGLAMMLLSEIITLEEAKEICKLGPQ